MDANLHGNYDLFVSFQNYITANKEFFFFFFLDEVGSEDQFLYVIGRWSLKRQGFVVLISLVPGLLAAV